MTRATLGLLLLLACFAGGCRTTVGNYFGNRARDFGHCFQAEVGLGLGFEVDAGAAGLLHLGGGMAIVPEGGTLGWCWGEPLVPGMWPDDIAAHGIRTSERFYPFAFLAICGKELHSGHWHGAGPGGRDVQACYCLLPIMTGSIPRYVGRPPDADERWRRVHLLDIHAGFTLGVVRIRAGFSPGEFLDFLLGWFGVDIAGDDVALQFGTREGEE